MGVPAPVILDCDGVLVESECISNEVLALTDGLCCAERELTRRDGTSRLPPRAHWFTIRRNRWGLAERIQGSRRGA
jgi:hypothetical protein